MNTLQIIKHMRDTMPAWFSNVDGAASVEWILDNSRLKLPAFYVKLDPDSVSEFIPQPVEVRVQEYMSIVAVLDNTQDKTGKYAQSQIDLLRQALISTLMGYVNKTSSHALIYAGSRMVAMDEARYVHEFSFKQESAFNLEDGYQPSLDYFNKMYTEWNMSHASEDSQPNAEDHIKDIYPLDENGNPITTTTTQTA